MWPVYLLINELPISARKTRSNVLFYGIWVGRSKPEMSNFLEPLYREMRVLEEGYEFCDYTGNNFNCKCVLLTCTCDLPARAMVYNSVQYNGYYGCWHCMQPGERFRFEGGGSSHIFPYDPNVQARSDQNIIDSVQKATENIQKGAKTINVNSHKGPFWFMYLKYTPITNSCVIDYMQGVWVL